MHCLTSTIKTPQMLYQLRKNTYRSLVLSLVRPIVRLWATEAPNRALLGYRIGNSEKYCRVNFLFPYSKPVVMVVNA